MKKTLGSLLGAGALVLAGCSDKTPLPEPKREDFKSLSGICSIYIPISGSVKWNMVGDNEAYITDEDQDGKADYIRWGREIKYIAKDFTPKFGWTTPETRIMSDEMRDVATQSLKATKELGYLTARDFYESKQKKGN